MLKKAISPLKRLYEESKNQTACLICFNTINNHDISLFFGQIPIICGKCSEKFKPKFINFFVEGCKALALYEYDENMKELIYKFKGCYDYVLGELFLAPYQNYYHMKFKDYSVVCAPSYFSDNLVRGFNHVEAIFKSLKLPMIQCFVKVANIKQSSQISSKRKNIKNIIKLSDKKSVKNKKILLVDDIYTTGATMKRMISLLRQVGAKDIKIMVIAKTKLH